MMVSNSVRDYHCIDSVNFIAHADLLPHSQSQLLIQLFLTVDKHVATEIAELSGEHRRLQHTGGVCKTLARA